VAANAPSSTVARAAARRARMGRRGYRRSVTTSR